MLDPARHLPTLHSRRPPPKVQIRKLSCPLSTIGIPVPSTNASLSRISFNLVTALRESSHPGLAPATTASAERQRAYDAGLPPPSQRARPSPATATTDTLRRGQSTSITRQLRPARRMTFASPSRVGASASGWTEPSSVRPNITERSIGLLKLTTRSPSPSSKFAFSPRS